MASPLTRDACVHVSQCVSVSVKYCLGLLDLGWFYPRVRRLCNKAAMKLAGRPCVTSSGINYAKKPKSLRVRVVAPSKT